MPRYLPRPDLPPILYEALVEQSYQNELKKYFDSLDEETKKLKKFSATTLSRSPRERILSERHDHEIVKDPIEGRFWSLLGQTAHLLLERRARPSDVAETRLGMNVGPFPDGSFMHVHAMADCLYTSEDKIEGSNGELLAYVPAHTCTDYKLTSAWSLVRGEKFTHHAQLNLNKAIMNFHGFRVDHLKNYFLFKDWRKADADKHQNYPKDKIVAVDVPVWAAEKTKEWYMDRLWKHASVEHLPDDELPYCTDSERWMDLPVYKVYKLDEEGKRQKNSKFTSNSKLEAQEWMDETQAAEWTKITIKNTERAKPKPESDLVRPKYIIREIPAQPTFCFHCSARPFCRQFAEDVAKGYVKNEPEPENEEEN